MRRALFAVVLAAGGCTPNSSPPIDSYAPPVHGASVTIKGATVAVEYLRADNERRWPAYRKESLADGHGTLTGWPHDRFLYLTSYFTYAAFDVAFLAADGAIVEVAKLAADSDEGVTSSKEVRWVLLLPAGWLGKKGVGAGDAVEFSKEIREAQPAAMAELSIGDVKVRAELSPKDWERTWGLMHRRRMSADDGMLFMYAGEKERKFWMGHCHFALDIAYFDAKRRLLNVVSIDPYPDPNVDPGLDVPGSRAPSAGPAQYALEMHKGWFRRKGLVDAAGKPVRALTLDAPAAVLKIEAE